MKLSKSDNRLIIFIAIIISVSLYFVAYINVFHIDDRIRQLRFMISIYFGPVRAGFREQLNLAWLGALMQFAPLASISLFQCDDESLKVLRGFVLSKSTNILHTLTRYKRRYQSCAIVMKNIILVTSEKATNFF